MKKLVSLMMAIVMACSLAACGAKEETPAAPSAPAASAAQPAATGYEWPTRPVNITVAASAGGATDIIARKYAEKFQEITGQPMVITNVSGASAYVTGKTADADGYNFVTMSTAFLTYKHQGKVDFTWDEGYDTAAMYGVSPLIGIVVRADSPYQTVNDLLEAAKKNPDGIICGGGSGTPYYWKLSFDNAAGTTIYTAALGDTNELNVALLGQQVDAIVSRYTAVKSYIESGDFRMLCIATDERSDICPDVPTCKESGIDFVFSPEMVALMCPKGTPVEAREAMNEVFAQIHADEAFKAEMLAMGQEFLAEESLEDLENFIATAQEEIMVVIEQAEG